MDWVLGYLGKPWAAGADGPDAYDCWGLVRAVYRERLGVELPVIDVDALSPLATRRALAEHPERARWRACSEPEPYAVALMSYGTRPHHVGVWTGAGVLHALEGAGVLHQSLASLAAHRWRVLELYARERDPRGDRLVEAIVEQVIERLSREITRSAGLAPRKGER